MGTGGAADAVRVGWVGKPFGLKGDVYVRPDVNLGEPFDPGMSYEREDGSAPLVVATSMVHAGRQIVRFEGCSSREDAEELRGAVLLRDRADVPLEADAFWSDELIGREVVDPSGAVVGIVEATLDGPAHDYLVVARPDGGEALVPAVSELLDIGRDQIVLRPIPGLLDLGEADEAGRR